MEKASNSMNNTVSTGWIKTTKENAMSSSNTSATTPATEEKIVSRVTFEQNPYAQVSFNTYQDILDKRNQMLGMVKPSLYQYDAD
jgi:hypothetical protein